MDIENIFHEAQLRQINDAVADAESRTSAEIVPVLTDASGDYDRAEDMCGLLFALVAVAVAWGVLQGVEVTPGWSDTNDVSLIYTLPMMLVTFLCAFVAGTLLATHAWWLRFLFTPRRFREACVHRGAVRAFHEFHLSKTAGATGVLLYVSLFERSVYVLGDDAIGAMLTNDDFGEVRDAIVTGFREGRPTEGICAGIQICGEKLAPHFPIKPDDVDELPNNLRIYRQGL